jgi:lipid-A-disaccharide synthase
MERRLRAAHIPAVHMVSPTVWAWRPGRVKGIRRSVDLMLSIFPFEEEFLREHGVPARYIGHPLADEIPVEVDRAAARASLGLEGRDPIVAILPGSRAGEVKALATPFLETAVRCRLRSPRLRFVVPLVNSTLRELFERALAQVAPDLPISMVGGRSREVIAASDCVLTASGTATLETLLLGRPMVVGYRMSSLTYWLIKGLGLVKVPYIAMANLLAQRPLAPEFIQDRCRAELLAPAVLRFLERPEQVREIQAIYARIHGELRRNAGRSGAEAILELIGSTGMREGPLRGLPPAEGL